MSHTRRLGPNNIRGVFPQRWGPVLVVIREDGSQLQFLWPGRGALADSATGRPSPATLQAVRTTLCAPIINHQGQRAAPPEHRTSISMSRALAVGRRLARGKTNMKRKMKRKEERKPLRNGIVRSDKELIAPIPSTFRRKYNFRRAPYFPYFTFAVRYIIIFKWI